MTKNDKVKLFLVDDDAVSLKLMQIEFLQQTEFEVETYPTGEACVAHLSHNPDLIILDYHLDGIEANAMNGMQTLDKIKAFHQNIPVAGDKWEPECLPPKELRRTLEKSLHPWEA